MQDWAQRYSKIASQAAVTSGAEVWLSPAVSDPWWDEFLRRAPCGQYQQSSLWAEYKAGEGWNHHRMVIAGPAGIAGGVQILWKKTRLGRLGYVSKGPVADPETPAIIDTLVQLLGSAAKELRLSGLIVQQPDETQASFRQPEESGFIQSNPRDVIEATYLVEVGAGMETVRSRMHPKVRQYVRKAQQAGVVVRAGTEADLPVFFELMCATCRRQHSTPNPPSLESVRRLWKIFHRDEAIEMSFAEGGGVTLAGRLNFLFGPRVTQWKKGWDGSHGHWHPNELLADQALEWAHAHGYKICDFSAISRPIALRIMAGRPKDAADPQARDKFNLRLGGYPKLLPRAMLLLRNPVLRWGYINTYGRFELRRERRLLADTGQTGLLPSA